MVKMVKKKCFSHLFSPKEVFLPVVLHLFHLFFTYFSPIFFGGWTSATNTSSRKKHCFTYFSPIFHLFFTYFIFHLLLIKIDKRHFFTWFAPIFHLFFTYFAPIFHLCFTYVLFHLFFMKHWPTHSFTYFHLFSPIYLFFTYFSPILFFTCS